MSTKKTSKSAGAGRTRNYATVVYPESAPDNWKDLLTEFFIPAFISPLHDRDINPGGEPKKPHYHVIIMFDSVKTVDQAKAVFEKIGGVGCEVIASIRGYARYLCHLDNPEKAQYDPEHVTCLCGSDYSGVCSLASDKYKCIKEMLYWCVENNTFAFSDLLFYAMEERPDWFRMLADNSTLIVKEALKSLEWKERKSKLEYERKLKEGF